MATALVNSLLIKFDNVSKYADSARYAEKSRVNDIKLEAAKMFQVSKFFYIIYLFIYYCYSNRIRIVNL